MFSLVWLAVPLGALGFLGWIHAARIQHVRYVSGLGDLSDVPTVAAGGAHARAVNQTILPEGQASSYHWVLQTQQMFSRGEARVRQIDYENAPVGRKVESSSPYRWWLGLVAWCDHAVSERPITESVARAALVADPLLHGLLVIGVTLLLAWRFGALVASLTCLVLAVTFPFAATFAGGAPDDLALAQVFTIPSVLWLAVGVGAPGGPKATRRWFFAAGVAGGLGVWVNPFGQLAITGGLVLGGLLAAWVARRGEDEAARLPWRAWALGGAVTTLASYLMEYAPGGLASWRMHSPHPLYALAWLGGGDLLVRLSRIMRGDGRPRSAWQAVGFVAATMALAAPLVVLWRSEQRAAFIPAPQAFQLSKLTGSVDAGMLLAVVLPLLAALPAVWLLFRPKAGLAVRASIAIALGALLVTVVIACHWLEWWSRVDAVLLVLLAVTAGHTAKTWAQRPRWIASMALTLLFLPGLCELLPSLVTSRKGQLSRSEMIALVDRDLARWIAQHRPDADVVVLAPPGDTTALSYYGGLRGIGSLTWENRDGVAAAMRILSAPTAQEAKELIDQRGITHVVLLSWDSYFDAYARAGTGQVEGTFRDQLKPTALPRWLRPVAYQLPAIEGFEGATAKVFEVVEEQDEATALMRITGYVIDVGDHEALAAVGQELPQFPTSFGAWVARAEIQQTRGEEAEFTKSLAMLKRRLASKQPPPLPWDERVRLAVILGKAKELTLAREQVSLCVNTADEGKLRALSASALYRLLVLGRHFQVELDPKLQTLALELLPTDLRERVR